MIRFIGRRLLALPFILLLANFLGYAYAFFVGPIQAIRNPYSFGAIQLPPLLPEYATYLGQCLRFDCGIMSNREPILQAIARTGLASLGLLGFSLIASVLLGVLMGVTGAKTNPPRVASWLTIVATIGLASPSFYIGIWLIALSVVYLLWGPSKELLLPFQGYGWDSHLVLPVVALMVRPAVQIAQVTASLLAGELGKQYVVAARSFGHTWRAIRWRDALRNMIASVILVIAGALRLLVAELIIIERLFNWPGFGRLLASTLVTTSFSDNFLYPPLVAALVTVLAAVFMLADFLASLLIRMVDPRLRDGTV